MPLFLKYVFIVIVITCPDKILAQNNARRYEIDAKRVGVNYYDKDALPLSREFIRLDSTYYVGWFYEGMYKFERAADYLGYRNCIEPLRKSLSLFERNYRNNFKEIFVPGNYTMPQVDAIQLCNAIYDCYSNIEQPDSAMWLLEKVRSWNTGNDFMEYHIKAAWTIHRNRYYLHKYSFLKNSVAENEQLALNHLYDALAIGDGNAVFYLAIIHNYLLNVDSTAFYYNILKQAGGFSYNNYAHFQNTIGNFAEAIDNFENDKYAFDKRLIESYYFLPTLYINSGQTKKAIDETNSIITTMGSTPGFGWYNIALARSYLYNGQLDSCEKAITKAAQFKELHIGTTLGQEQYNFAVNVIKLLLAKSKIGRIKFFNEGWWYSLSDLSSIAALKGEQFLLKFALVSEISRNPERQQVIYNLFTSENVIGFDEVLNLMKNISPEYFEDVYKQKAIIEKRPNVARYMQFFAAEFQYENGEQALSKQNFENIYYNTILDTAHEKLFLARLYESLARSYADDGETDNSRLMVYHYFKEYPQLIPFSGFKVKMYLNTPGSENVTTKKIISELKDCNINWVDEPDNTTARVYLSFSATKNKYSIDYSVVDASGKTIVAPQKMFFRKVEGVGKELGLRIFGVSGAVDFQ